MDKLAEIDDLKRKYNRLYIEKVRLFYDNNRYTLISGVFIFAVEYILNSNFEYSIQEFRVIEDLSGENMEELAAFKELDIIKLP